MSNIGSRDLVLGGSAAALMAVIAQISIPMPTGVPLTLMVFGVTLIGVVLGWKLGGIAIGIYLLCGAVGLPVFANFGGGFSRLAGLSGGYLWSFPALAMLAGIRPRTGNHHLSLAVTMLFALVGLAIVETIGGVQWSLLSGGSMSLPGVFAYSMVAFVPKDMILTVAAVLVGNEMKKRLPEF